MIEVMPWWADRTLCLPRAVGRACPEHGTTRQTLSRHGAHWAELDTGFFDVHQRPAPQHDFIGPMAERCNLDCPI